MSRPVTTSEERPDYDGDVRLHSQTFIQEVTCRKEKCMSWGKVKQYDNDGSWVEIEGCKLIEGNRG